MSMSGESSNAELGDYRVTLWGRRALLEPVTQAVLQTPDDPGSLGWLRVLLDLVEEQGLSWREHADPASGYPFRDHEDGMPPVPLTESRARKPVVLLGHSPFADRSNLLLDFKGTSQVNLLLQVVAERVPGVDVNVRFVAGDTAYEWDFKRGKIQRSSSRGL